MFQDDKNLIASYKELIKLLSHRNDFIIEDRNLIGINLITNKRYSLAKRNENFLIFEATTDINGSYIIDLICKKFSVQIKSKTVNQINFEITFCNYFKNYIASLGHQKKYIEIE